MKGKEKTMRRSIAFLLALVLMVSLLAACGNTQKTPNETQAPAQSGEEVQNTPVGNFIVPEGGYDGSAVEIVFYNTMGANLSAVLEKYIAEFNKLYPNITVVSTNVGNYDDCRDQISTEITVGNQPNIAYCYPDHVALYNLAKAVSTLDNLIASEIEVKHADGTTELLGLTAEQIADFIPGYYNEGKQFGDGLMYTMPLSKSTEVLYYNKTFFEENGLKVPTTWDEMEETCKKLLELDPKCIPLGYDSEDNWFITMCEQGGYDYTSATGDHYLFNNDDCKAFVKRFRDWYQKGYVTTEALYGGYTSGLFTELDKNTSHSYMCIGSSGGAGYQIPEGRAFEVGIASIPQVNPDAGKVISQGPSVCILKGGKTTDQEVLASWLFVKYLTTNMAFQTEFSSVSGYMPVLESAQDDPAYSQWLAKANGAEFLTAYVVKVGLEQADYYFTSPAFNGSSVARAQVGGVLSKCMSEETNDVDKLIDDTFQAAYSECVYMGG